MTTKTYQNFDVQTDHHGVVTVTLNVPDRPLNILTREAMSELKTIVDGLEKAMGVTAVVFRSGKESGFLAGADVSVIAAIRSPGEAMLLIESGQALFDQIESLPMPTIAVIHGPCLGGGLEWSLACDYRIARDNSSTKIGLPEIQLGLIPGWGGTQRLPRRVGLSHALPLILTGKHLSASEAAKIGLVNEAISPERWEKDIERFVDQAMRGTVAKPVPGPLWRRWLDGTFIGRALTVRSAKRSIRSKAKHYPALAAALRAAEKSHEGTMHGYATERNEFAELLSTTTCQNLLGLFFARDRAKKLSTWSSQAAIAMHSPPIRRVGVVGAGAMGAGIGQLAATRGYDVVLKEIDAAACQAGQARITSLVDDLARRKKWDASDRQQLLEKITIGTDRNLLSECDLVIEAVVERADVKANVFRELDGTVEPSAILTSNTSSLSVTRMAEATSRAHQVAGLHFFNPVHRMELVEVVRGHETDDATVARLVGFVKTLGKTPVVTADVPGFLVNRVLFPYLGEAILMVADGYDVNDIDRQIRDFGMPMGPLELLDQVGLDVALHVAGSLRDVLSNVEPVVSQLAKMVDQGQLGKKTNRGFYRYHGGKRRVAKKSTTRFDSPKLVKESDFRDDSMSAITRRLVYPMLTEAIRCHQESVVQWPWAIDLAMVLGTGFAPHRGGPLHMVDAIGRDVMMANLSRLQQTLGDRFAIPDELIEMRKSGDLYFTRTQSSDVPVTH